MTDRPLRLHFVWSGTRFPYYCRLAIESALVAMPAARIRVHVLGPVPDGQHVRSVATHGRVEVRQIDLADAFGACPYGAAPYLRLMQQLPTPAARSNLLRLAILHRDGGVYLDTDVLVLRGLHDPAVHGTYVGQEWVWAANRARLEGTWTWRQRLGVAPWAARSAVTAADVRVLGGRLGVAERWQPGRSHRLQINNAVVGAPPGSAFVQAALVAALDVDPGVRFALGPSLLDDVARALPRSVHLLPPSRFYAVPPGQSARWFSDRHLELPPDAQVMHYVASNHRKLLAKLEIDDPRFARAAAPFWRRAAEVRAAIGGERPTPAVQLLRAV